MQTRHDELAAEMVRRGGNHKSPYTQPNLDYLSSQHRYAVVDQEVSIRDLKSRCPDCFNFFNLELKRAEKLLKAKSKPQPIVEVSGLGLFDLD